MTNLLGWAYTISVAVLASMLAPVGFTPPLAQATPPARTILAIGAHAGDAELTSGLLLAQQRRLGDRTVILHLTLGEGGNPKLTPAAYGEQKRREALAVGGALGAEVLFAPYRDGELPDDEATRRYVAQVIRQVKPTYVLYLDYYSALMTVPGAESRKGRAVSFDIDQIGKRRVIDSLP